MSNQPGTAETPWTAEQVDSLNAFQKAGGFHPFTCGNDECRASTGGEALLATPSGWVCRRCAYRQHWAHSWMADWSWQAPSPSMAADIFSGVHDQQAACEARQQVRTLRHGDDL